MTHTIALEPSTCKPLASRSDNSRPVNNWMTERVDAAKADEQTLDAFLKHVERRGFRMAELATGNREDALDVVQDAMFGFVRHYARKPAEDWAPLFFRVLDSRLNDWHRRKRVRARWTTFFGRAASNDEDDEIARAQDPNDPGPLRRVAGDQTAQALDGALQRLPLRQRQTFLLRVWEGFDVASTAETMRCSEGSVKTHLSRALTALRRELGDYL